MPAQYIYQIGNAVPAQRMTRHSSILAGSGCGGRGHSFLTSRLAAVLCIAAEARAQYDPPPSYYS
jgi:hypothetical protein